VTFAARVASGEPVWKTVDSAARFQSIPWPWINMTIPSLWEIYSGYTLLAWNIDFLDPSVVFNGLVQRRP
jgi:hypothetical protein